MPAPQRKRTSDETFKRIVEAIEKMAADDESPRTKREIERLTGYGHDAVARAFRQDATEDNDYRITAKFKALTAELTASRVSPDRDKQIAIQRENRELKDQVRHLNQMLDAHAMSLFAVHLRDTHATAVDATTNAGVVPIRRRRRDDE
ncbi:MAG: hypothetical protein ABIR39_21835 [Nocardioides sp.]|uniref:hypothetical protein n=1 Tax=Nocardioides sp. TaxID=35761 RepID=UPI003264DC76